MFVLFWMWLSKNKSNLKSWTWMFSAACSAHAIPLGHVGHVPVAGRKCWLNWQNRLEQGTAKAKRWANSLPPVWSHVPVLWQGDANLTMWERLTDISMCVLHRILGWHRLAALWCPVIVIKTFSKSAGVTRDQTTRLWICPNRLRLMGPDFQVRSSSKQHWLHSIFWQLQGVPAVPVIDFT